MLPHKKRVIKWENVFLVIFIIIATTTIIKSLSKFIPLIIIFYILTIPFYYKTIKLIRKNINRKGIIKSFDDLFYL